MHTAISMLRIPSISIYVLNSMLRIGIYCMLLLCYCCAAVLCCATNGISHPQELTSAFGQARWPSTEAGA